MVADLLRLADPVLLPVVIALSMIGLFHSVRNLCLGNRGRNIFASTVLYGVLLLALSAVEFWASSIRSPGLLASGPVPDARPERYANIPMDQREKYSRGHAAYIFANYGVLASHFDALGQWRPFVSTQQEISDREIMLQFESTLASTKANAFVAGAIALFAAFIAVFLGWRAARLQRLETDG
jgi:hypothetical protein